MSYVKNYEYDIFISYAHLDNTKLLGEDYGWIESFYKNLSMLLMRRTGDENTIKIWWDERLLDGATQFDPAIEEGLRNSALLVCLTSSAYIRRNFCLQELATFHTAATSQPLGLSINNRSRILNVQLNNIPYTQWPQQLQGTSGYKFNDSRDSNDLGDPLEYNRNEFKVALQDLRDSIMLRLDEIAAFTPVPVQPQENGGPPEDAPGKGFSIYMGDVPDSLRITRKRTIIELEKKGFTVLTDVPPPFESALHEVKVREALQKADMAVHLLDQYPGREIQDARDISYPHKQTELALETGKPQIIWVPESFKGEEVEDERYRMFMQHVADRKKYQGDYDYIQGNKSSLAREIMDRADEIIKKRLPVAPADKLSVLLDTHYNDQVYAWELGRILVENHIQPQVNPQEDNPLKNIEMLADRIKQVSKIIFFYGKVSKDWVKERMKAAAELIITHEIPVNELLVLVLPPHKSRDEGVPNLGVLRVRVYDKSNEPRITPASVSDLLQILKEK